jgi:hypothetical protein
VLGNYCVVEKTIAELFKLNLYDILGTCIEGGRNGLKKHYNKDLTERYILNMIRSLGKLVIKERTPATIEKPFTE